MEEQVLQYIEKLIIECVQSEKFASFTPEQKEELAGHIRNHFQNMIFDTLIDNLTDEQVNELKDLDLTSEEAENKVAELAAQIPDFVYILDEKINKEAQIIKETGQIPQDQV